MSGSVKTLGVICAILVGFVCKPCLAQVASGAGSISGIVSDPTGAAIPAAAITVVNTTTGVQRSSRTDTDGRYYVLSLRPGVYNVEVKHAGFRASTQTGVEITIEREAVVDFKLEVGAVGQQIEVHASPPLVESSNATIGEVITNEKILALPLNGRSFAQLALLAPQVISGGVGVGNGQADLQNTSIGTQGAFSISGARNESVQFTFNGIVVTNEFVGGSQVFPPIDSLEEFKIEENVYSAELGGEIGQVILTGKTGTNQFHGSAYEFVRNSKFDANNFFNNRAGIPNAPLKQNQFGASLGGPIIRNRTFGFFNWESARIRRANASTATQPTALMRIGDFSQLLPGRNVNDPVTGQPFPNNVIPASRISPIATNIINLAAYPLPNLNSLQNNYTIAPTNQQNLNQYVARLDHNFSSQDQLWGSFYWTRLGLLNPKFTEVNDTKETTSQQTWTLQEVHIFSPSLINMARAGYVFISQDQANESPQTLTNAALGFPNNANQPLAFGVSAGIPFFSIAGYGVTGADSSSPRLFKTALFQFGDTLNWIRRSHSFKFGGDFVREHEDQRFNPQIRGNYTFSGQYTGNGFADFLLGLPASAQREIDAPGSNIFESLSRASHYSAFAQDDWKATSNLTINLGLRYEFNGGVYEARDRMVNFIVIGNQITEITPPASTGPGLKLSEYGRCLCIPKTHDFGPRVGLAYRPFGSGKTVIRAGYGIFYEAVPFNKRQSIAFNPPWVTRQIVSNTFPAPTFDLANTFLPSVVATAISAFRNDPNYFDPMVQQWNFSIQRAFSPSTMIELSYVGTTSTHLDANRTFNSAVPGPGPFAPRRPLANQPVLSSVDQGYTANYQAFTIKGKREFSQGLTFLAHYTFSKAIDDASSQTGYIAQNMNCAECNKGLSGFNVTNRFVGTVVYELPFGKGRRFLARSGTLVEQTLGGWNVSAIETLQSGFYTSATTTNNTANIEAGTLFPDVVGSVNLPVGQRTVGRWFNTAAFAQPAPYRFGTAGRSIIEGPGLANLDFAVHKAFAIREQQRVEFRFEVFNGLNHANFALPQNNLVAGNFGTITSAAISREIQLALKYVF
jgi:hypothetical protein